MKKFLVLAAFAGTMSLFSGATGAQAQTVRIEARPPGVEVTTVRHRREHWEERHDRWDDHRGRWDRGHRYGQRRVTVRDRADGCRVVTVRTRQPNGVMVIRKTRRCY